MEVIFYNFTKRKNSTKRPSGGTKINVYLKDASSVSDPVLEIRQAERPNYNYCYIPSFYRYYYVTKITYVNGIWEIEHTVDVLATYKTSITSSRAFINYADAYQNTNMIDNRIICLPTYTQTQIPFDILDSENRYTYFIRAAGAGDDSSLYRSGAAPLYVVDNDGMRSFMSQINDDSILAQIERFFAKPLDGIIECYALAISPELISKYCSVSSSDIYIGGAAISCNASVVTSQLHNIPRKYIAIDIPWRYSDFRRLSPYTSAYLHIPPFGIIDIPTAEIYNSNTLRIVRTLDIFTGDLSIIIGVDEGESNRYFMQLNSNIKVSLPVSSSSNNVGGVISGLTTAVGGAVATGAALATGGASTILTAGIGTAAGGLFNTFMSAATNVTRTVGGISGSVNSSRVLPSREIFCMVSHDTNVDLSHNANVAGYPVGSVQSLNISGYVQTDGASISINGYDSEREQVNSMLDAGIYIE